MNAIFNRRSVRQFSDKDVSYEDIMQILKAGMQAPSAGNQQGWEFIVVKDRSMLDKLADVHSYSSMLKQANFAIIPVGNDDRMPNLPMFWEQDFGACIQNIMLEATDLGLGTVWLGIAPKEDRMDYIRELFNLDKKIKPFAILAGGYPLSENANRFVDRFDESRVHFEKWEK